MNALATLGAMLRNARIGLQVLAAELYWLAGSDFAYRRARAKRNAAIAAADSAADGGQAEPDRLEAENAAAAARFAEDRARFLERLRKRTGLD
jgi:1-deoxy-D-xylulose 5-phosphate reductoisomerase